MEISRLCKECGLNLTLENFHKSKKGKYGVRSKCKKCCNLVISEWSKKNRNKINFWARIRRKENHEKTRSYDRKYKAKNREQILFRMREYYAKLRRELFEAYGNKCACCGELNKEFFAVDHINGGGTREKKKMGTRPLYRKIKAEGFPKDKYQILCHNCNMSLGFYGYCPHHPEITRPLHRPQAINIKFLNPA